MRHPRRVTPARRTALGALSLKLVVATALPALPALGQDAPPYLDPKLSVEARVGDLLSRMTVEEKVAQVTAQLRSGEARLVFDPETETTNIVLVRDLAEQ